MKKILLTIVTLTTLVASTQAALIAHWGFDTFTWNPAGGSSRTISPEDGIQTSATFTIDPVALIPDNKIASVTGTTVNDPRGTPAASFAIEFQGQTGNNNGATIHLSGIQRSFFFVTYAGKASAGGTSQNTWSWSTDGTTFSTVGVTQPGVIGLTYSTFTVDFSAVSALNTGTATDIYLRAVGAGGGNNTDYDNIQVLAQIPEPINVALALFGLGFVGLKFGRRLFSFVRR
jgi:hypothetical protein